MLYARLQCCTCDSERKDKGSLSPASLADSSLSQDLPSPTVVAVLLGLGWFCDRGPKDDMVLLSPFKS